MNAMRPLKFFKKNWYNTISLLLSLIAVLIALRANSIARQSISPNLSVTDGSKDASNKKTMWILDLNGCYEKNSKTYQLSLGTQQTFWISNYGGLDATLIGVQFASDFDKELKGDFILGWHAGMFEDNHSGAADSISELHVASGSTVPILVVANNSGFFPTQKAAIEYADSFTSKYNEYREQHGRWYFRFGNGTTLIHSYNTIFGVNNGSI